MSKIKKNSVLAIIAILLLAAGIGVICLPYIRQSFYQAEAKQAGQAFAARAARYTKEEMDEIYEQMLKYNRSLYEHGQDRLVDAFSYEEVAFSLTESGFEEDMAGYLMIPRMEIELPIYLGAGKENLSRGAAHLSQTSLPIGGDNTNAVIAAHRGMAGAEMFRHLDVLEPGDLIYITNYRETLVYQVTGTAVIRPDDIGRILIQPGRDMVTLITCHPYRYNYQRYIVYSERVDLEKG